MTKFLGPFINDLSEGDSNVLQELVTWVNTSDVISAYPDGGATSTEVVVYYNRISTNGRPIQVSFGFYDNLGEELPGVDYNYARFVTANLIDAFNSSPTDVIIEPQYPSGFPTRNIEVG